MHAFKSQSVMREVLSMLNCCYFNERFHLLQRVNTQQGYIIESVKYKTIIKIILKTATKMIIIFEQILHISQKHNT